MTVSVLSAIYLESVVRWSPPGIDDSAEAVVLDPISRSGFATLCVGGLSGRHDDPRSLNVVIPFEFAGSFSVQGGPSLLLREKFSVTRMSQVGTVGHGLARTVMYEKRCKQANIEARHVQVNSLSVT